MSDDRGETQVPGETGLDGGTGNPGQDRAHLIHQPPAEVSGDASSDGSGTEADASDTADDIG